MYRDFHHALRALATTPWFTFTAAAVLAAGIGAGTAVFTLINAIVPRPLPYPSPEQLVLLAERAPGDARNAVAASTFLDWQAEARSFSGMTAMQTVLAAFTGAERAERIPVLRATASLFEVFGVNAAFGRVFGAADDKPGAPRVAVLSHGFWQEQLGADPGALGRAIKLDGEPHVVIGVLPREFRFLREASAYVPLALDQASDLHNLGVAARLKPGNSLRQARAEMNTLSAAIAVARPEEKKGWGAYVDAAHERLTSGPRSDLPFIAGAVLFVLLIACANVTGLLLARGAGRTREMALRASLGASRARLIVQLLTEDLALASIAGASGVALAYWLVRLIAAAVPPTALPAGTALTIDAWVLLFALALSWVTAVVFGLVPALRFSRVDLNTALKQGGRGVAGGAGRLRRALVASEVALSLVLLAAAGLMITSLVRALDDRPGFDPDRLAAAGVNLTARQYRDDPVRVREFWREAVGRAGALPGVRSAAMASAPPLSGWIIGLKFSVADRPEGNPATRPATHFVMVSPAYFRTLGLPVLRGREFTERDDERSSRVAIVNETFARKYLAGEDALGKVLAIDELKAGQNRMGPPVRWEIVGVSRDVRAGSLSAGVMPEVFVPVAQNPWPGGCVLVRTDRAAESLVQPLRAAIESIDKNQPLTYARSLRQSRALAFRVPRMLTGMIGFLGAVALTLAVVGIYALVSYAVAQRRQELGVRTALGARPFDLVRLMMRQGLVPVLIGTAIGLAGAFAVRKLMARGLAGLSGPSAWAMAPAVLLLVIAAACACYFPARRAAATDPADALRLE